MHFFVTGRRQPSTSTLIPYTTLFRARPPRRARRVFRHRAVSPRDRGHGRDVRELRRRRRVRSARPHRRDRKSTRLNSSHLVISYAVFCLKTKKYDGSKQDIAMTESDI